MTQTQLSWSRKTLAPLGVITMAHARAEGLYYFFKLTQLTRIHKSKFISGLTNLSTSQSTYANHRVILLTTWVLEHMEMSTTCIGMFHGLPHLQMASWRGINSLLLNYSHWIDKMLLLSTGAPDSPVHTGHVRCLTTSADR
jgi:hypothetical protein